MIVVRAPKVWAVSSWCRRATDQRMVSQTAGSGEGMVASAVK